VAEALGGTGGRRHGSLLAIRGVGATVPRGSRSRPRAGRCTRARLIIGAEVGVREAELVTDVVQAVDAGDQIKRPGPVFRSPRTR